MSIAKFAMQKPEINGDCMMPYGKPDKNGYCKIQIGGHYLLAHRVAYQLFKGRIWTSHEIDHLCRNRACCNPAHLEAVTPWLNTHRSINHNRNKTECVYGHLFTPENTYSWKTRRYCKICRARREQWRKEHERQRSHHRCKPPEIA